MFIFNNEDELEKAFGVKPIETRGVRSGKIFKFRNCYLKIYDDPKHESRYIVQGYYYNSDIPFLEDSIPYCDINEYAQFFKD